MPFPVGTKIEIRDGKISKTINIKRLPKNCLDIKLKLLIKRQMFNEDSINGRLSEWVGTFKVKAPALRLY